MRKQLIALVIAAAPVFAQGGPPPGGPGMGHEGPGFGGPFAHAKVVTNAPFTATITNEVVRHLQDGDTVQHSTSGEIARDSQGRTYEKLTMKGGPFGETGTHTVIFISDPVKGVAYTLDPDKKIAFQRTLPSNTNSNRPAKDMPVPPDMTETALADDSSTGVNAQGKRRTHTIPAGAMGNSQPIISTTDTWYSPDLQMIVKAVRTDPFAGNSTFALSNIVMKEPDASLFTVPSGYTVKQGGPHGPGHGAPPPPPPGE